METPLNAALVEFKSLSFTGALAFHRIFACQPSKTRMCTEQGENEARMHSNQMHCRDSIKKIVNEG